MKNRGSRVLGITEMKAMVSANGKTLKCTLENSTSSYI